MKNISIFHFHFIFFIAKMKKYYNQLETQCFSQVYCAIGVLQQIITVFRCVVWSVFTNTVL